MIRIFSPSIIWMGIICYLSLAPSSSFPKIRWDLPIPADKLVHFTMYFVLLVSLYRNLLFLNPCTLFPATGKIILLLSCVSFGLLMEILQPLMHDGRTFQLSDVLANSTGALSGLLVYFFLLSRLKFFRKPYT